MSNSGARHTDFQPTETDPYESIRLLGHGGGGLVDEVVIRGAATRKCYARKQVTMGGPARRKEIVKQLQDEARIIRQLNHPHVVTVISTYTRGAVFGILMSPVADTDLKQFLEVNHEINQLGDIMRLRDMIWGWIGCLIRGLDYIHEMRVKHRDIKPSNILIKDNRVLFTDFGISKTISQDDTTGSDGTFGPMTRRYIAPEALKESGRRGRAMDIYSLGCVFLEIAAALNLFHVTTQEQLIKRLRECGTGTTVYAENPEGILTWICYNFQFAKSFLNYSFSGKLSELAFLMLDPNPGHRITSRQLVAMISKPASPYFKFLANSLCGTCASSDGFEDNNLPLHSVFTEAGERVPFEELGIDKTGMEMCWELAKRGWLQHHMWWES